MIDKKELCVPGIPDNLFVRGSIPMTKEEIRVITLSKARIGPGMVIWDIGSGTGSISVEAALMAPGGKVFAVERSGEGCRLISENSLLFGAGNVEVVEGEAPGILDRLPPASRVIVGGSGGRLKDIVRVVEGTMLSGGRLVINSVSLETLTSAMDCLGTGWETEVVQVSVSKSKTMGASHIMKAYNPVFIITAWRCGV